MKYPASTAAEALMLAAILMTVTAPSDIAWGQVRLSQIYGGGGNSGSVYTHDFIELFNAGTRPVDLGGWSVQYCSSSGSSWQKTRLAGTIAPRSWFLIQEARGAGGTTGLPGPDARGSIAMSSTAGKVVLAADTITLTGSCPGGPPVIDLVGFGPATGCFEGSGPAPAPGNTTAIFRKGGGLTETDDNAADFETGPPAPRNSAVFPLMVPQTERAPGASDRPPADLCLLRNYPNPFNPSTRFEFRVGQTGRATLRLYNVLGEEAACLFDGTACRGQRYVVPFQAGSLPAGIYLARLRTGSGGADLAVVLLR